MKNDKTQGGNTNDKGSDLAPTTSTVSAPEEARNQALTEQQKSTIRFAAEALEGLDYEDTAGDLREILRTTSGKGEAA